MPQVELSLSSRDKCSLYSLFDVNVYWGNAIYGMWALSLSFSMENHASSTYFSHLPKFPKLHWSGISTLFCPTLYHGDSCTIKFHSMTTQTPILLPLQKACWLHLSDQRRDALPDISETPGWAELYMSLDGMS